MATTAAPAAARGDNHDGASSSRRGRSFYRQRGDNISDSGASLLLRLIEISEPRIFQRAGLGLAKAQRRAVRRGDAGDSLAGRLLGLLDHLADAWPARLARGLYGRGGLTLGGLTCPELSRAVFALAVQLRKYRTTVLFTTGLGRGVGVRAEQSGNRPIHVVVGSAEQQVQPPGIGVVV